MTQIKKEVFNQLIGVTDSVEAPAKLLEILYDTAPRTANERCIRSDELSS